ncbi:hypothetical protein [Frateuria sp. STR12]|uniref:hypothetical protein n=1 Tax=Frateuria hangzhouensis TaxID=2995589 RepID=UPI002260E0E5|nr:hypothetical protein [Frateuria sp. STR12]MCX7513441.1 hypothetical protein [Frateuria sp. STR12]
MLLAVFIFFAHLDTTKDATLDNSYHQIESISLKDYPTTMERVQLLSDKYSELIKPWQSKLSQLSPEQVATLFQAADLVGYYSGEPKFVDDMEADVSALEREGKATAHDRRDLYEAFLQTRQFNKARIFSAAHPDLSLEEIPKIDGAKLEDRPSSLLVSENGKSLAWHNVKIGSSQIVVVSHPECHFTQNAVRYIEDHPALARVLAEHSTWIAPPGRSLDVDAISSWNRDHPSESIALASAQSDWPMISSWETPAFYFLKDGQLVETVIGWPKGGNTKALADGLRKIGLHYTDSEAQPSSN